MDIEKLITKMTVEEKAALVSGTDYMYTNPIPRLDIPSLSMADGPHGLRKQIGDADSGVACNGISHSGGDSFKLGSRRYAPDRGGDRARMPLLRRTYAARTRREYQAQSPVRQKL